MTGKPPAPEARQPNFAEAQRPDKAIRLAHPGRQREADARHARLIAFLSGSNTVELRLRRDLTLHVINLSFLLEICLTRPPSCYKLRPVEARPPWGRLGLMCEPTAVGRQPHKPQGETHLDGRLAHESQEFYSGRRTVALGGAAGAAMLGMGTAHADADGYRTFSGPSARRATSRRRAWTMRPLMRNCSPQIHGYAVAFDKVVDAFEARRSTTGWPTSSTPWTPARSTSSATRISWAP